MPNVRLTYLFELLRTRKISPEERAELMQLMADPANEEQAEALMGEYWDQFEPSIGPFTAKHSQDLLARINEEAEIVLTPSRFRLWPRIAAAASIILMLGAGGYFYYQRHAPKQQNQIANDVAPGHQGATLTLANGKKIILTQAVNGRLAKEAGVTISKTANGQLVYNVEGASQGSKINTLSTDNGETYKVHLPDGSDVWLNSASSLTYNTTLNDNGKRIVSLTGEAYFEIAKDKAHPFIVHTDKQDVEVLGTHFNINSYKDEPAVATTLLEGSVKVTSGTNRQIIKPGEQAINNGAGIKVATVDVDNITDWKDGDFNLNHVDFKVAMRKVARWYDVEIIYDKSVPDDIETGGWISRKQKLSAVLKFIESSGLVHFKMEGKKIYISK
jgi:ferric-dicitrate binding protein FerR (iron transport regulator)